MTYLACALGVTTSRSFYSVRHIRLPDLLVEISVARANGTYRDYMKKLRKEKLLILHEWLLYPLKEAKARDLCQDSLAWKLRRARRMIKRAVQYGA